MSRTHLFVQGHPDSEGAAVAACGSWVRRDAMTKHADHVDCARCRKSPPFRATPTGGQDAE